MAQEILDLNALAPERPLARIKTEANPEGDLYELLVPEDVGTVELATITRLFTQHDELWEKDKRTKADDVRLEKISNELTQRLIPDAPAEAIAALSAIAKRGLAVRFFVEAGLASKEALGTALVSQLTSSSPD